TCLLFPRLCVITPRGVFLSLSHFCPTAAELLFREDQTIAESIEPVVDPSAYPRDGRYAGLDARTHRPPLLRPDAPISWEGYALWERHTLDFISQERFTPEEALILLATTAEKLRAWKGVGSPSVEYLQQVFRQEFAMEGDTVKEQIAQLPTGALQGLRAYQLFFSLTEDETCALRVVREAFDHAYEGLTPEEVDRRFLADYGQLLAPFWAQFQGPVRRYLASRLHANYFAYQGKGLRTGLWAVISCLTALRVHAVLVCLSQNGPLDRSRLREAFRLTDFLISHSFRRDWLAQHFSQIENRSFMDLIGSVPL
ncbi:hypothetical protein HQ520_13605, partial [bacterium]|nr:hypothetical protein [bacterium]